MSNTHNLSERHHFKRLESLLFGRVTHIVVDDSDDSENPYVGLFIKTISGETYEVIALRDPEGNGPGHLAMEKVNVQTAVG